jgi:hypothetical protein
LSTADASPSLNTSKKIPGLYQTENVPLEDKIIFQRYHIKEIGFYWLVSELDQKENIAFGFANLNDEEMAEWGEIDISELVSNSAVLDSDWKPCTFSQAKKQIAEERSAGY